MSGQPTPLQVAEAYFVALNTSDMDALAELFHPDMDLVPTGSPPRSGREQCVDFLAKVFQRFPEHNDRPTRLLVDGSTVVAEIHFTGRFMNGQEVDFHAVDVFDIAEGRIRRLSQWFDTAALFSTLDG